MKGTIFAAAALAATVSAQATSNPDGTFTCAKANAAYCAGDSLKTNIIIRCNADKKGSPGNCNDNLAGIPPVGVKTFAPCYQTSETAGDAVCSFDGIAHPDNGDEPFKIPGVEPTGSVTDTATGSATGTETGSATGTGYPSGSGSATGSDYPTGSAEPSGSGSDYPTGTDSGAPYPTNNSTATGTGGTDYPTASGSGAYGSGTGGGSDTYPTASASGGSKTNGTGNPTLPTPSSPTGTNAASAMKVGANLALGVVGVAAYFML